MFPVDADELRPPQRRGVAQQDQCTVAEPGEVVTANGDKAPDIWRRQRRRLALRCPTFAGDAAQDIADRRMASQTGSTPRPSPQQLWDTAPSPALGSSGWRYLTEQRRIPAWTVTEAVARGLLREARTDPSGPFTGTLKGIPPVPKSEHLASVPASQLAAGSRASFSKAMPQSKNWAEGLQTLMEQWEQEAPIPTEPDSASDHEPPMPRI